MVAFGVAEVGEVVNKKCTRLLRELDWHFKLSKSCPARSTFEDEVGQNVHQSVARARFHRKMPNSDGICENVLLEHFGR